MKCEHDWRIIDKWVADGSVFWEFYCTKCLELDGKEIEA